MIDAAWCRMMARYNLWQNRGLYDEVGAMDEAERLRDRGAFFGSIGATLNHLLWADLSWMHRLAGWDRPAGRGKESTTFTEGSDDLRRGRRETDQRILRWAEDGPDIAGDLTWRSGVLGRDVTRPRASCVTHMFNHQTHHRGQIHAMMTAAGRRLPDTDLVFMPDDA